MWQVCQNLGTLTPSHSWDLWMFIPPKNAMYPLVISYIAIENGPVEIVDLPIKNGGSFHSLLFTRGYQLCSDFVVRITAAMMFIGWSRGERADFGIPSFEMRDEKL